LFFSDDSYQFQNPAGIATDSQGNVWVANYGDTVILDSGSVTKIPAAAPKSPIIYSGSNYQFAHPQGIVTDYQGNVWITNWGGNSVTEIPSTTPKNPIVYSNSSYQFDYPAGIVSDQHGNVWVINHYGNTVTELLKTASHQ